MASTVPAKDAAPPRRPTSTPTSGTATRRPAPTSSTTRTSTPATRPLSSATSRSSLAGTGLNKPLTRPAPGTVPRRAGLISKPASSDADPELSSVTSGDEKKKPAVRRSMMGSAAPSSPREPTSRSSLTPSTTTVPKRPLSTRSAAETSAVRATPRASLTSSTRTTMARLPNIRAAPMTTTKAGTGMAKAPSTPIVPEHEEAPPEHLLSPASTQSSGTIKDKAVSDAEVDTRKGALGPVKAALAKLGGDAKRPGTVPNGSKEVDVETKRRSMEIMQDFLQETTLREKLQEQCDDLNREMENLQSEKVRLKQELTAARAAIEEKDKVIAAAPNSDQLAHITLVEDMEKKFAQETKQLEEQSQKLEQEKHVAQEKSFAESTRASELQQVLNDLSQELEQQGRQWDAEKQKLVEQASQIESLDKELTTLKKERENLSNELAISQDTLAKLQTKLADLQQGHSDDISSRDEQDEELKTKVKALEAEAGASAKRHKDALRETQESLNSKLSESLAIVEKYANELRRKDESIAGHIQLHKALQDDFAKLQQRADQVSLDLEAERDLHAENIRTKVAKVQELSDKKLSAKEDEVSGHVKSINDLQRQISTLQQGSSDGANAAEGLHKEIEELNRSYDAALKIKADENDELVQRLEAINKRLGNDAAELAKLRDESEGLRETIQTLEQVSQRDESRNAANTAKIQAELNEVKTQAESHKAELDAACSKHQEALRHLGADHEEKIKSLRSVHQMQHEDAVSGRIAEIDALKQELSTLQANSSSAAEDLIKALEKHKQVAEEKDDLDEAHDALQKQVADLQARHDALLEEKNSAEQAHSKAIEVLKAASANASQQSLDDLQSKYDSVAAKLAELGKSHRELVAEKASNQEVHSRALQAQQGEIEQKYATLLEALQAEATGLEQEKRVAVAEKQFALSDMAALEKELSAEIGELKTQLASQGESGSAGLGDATKKYEALLAEKEAAEKDHEAATTLLRDNLKKDHDKTLSVLQSKHNALQQQIEKTDQQHADALKLLKEELNTGHANEMQTIQQQLDTLQKQHTDLMEEKVAINKAHKGAMSDLMADMESSTNDAVQQLQNKYDVLRAQHDAIQTTHAAQLEATKAAHASALEASISDVTEQQAVYRDLLTRRDQVLADVQTHAQHVEELRDTIREVEGERDRAVKATRDAEDRMETMKGEVVRKHLARVEPLEKENVMLHDKVERLEAIMAAGDRIARAAASIGEKRDMGSLMEEDEDAEGVSSVAGAESNGVPKDVMRTLAAMQETLHQLSELNNDAILESSRTVQQLTEQD